MTDEKKPLSHVNGIVTQPPTERQAGEYKIVTFGIAVSTGYTDEDKPKFYDVTVWKEALQPVIMAQIYKGAKVAVSGTESVREYDGKSYLKITGTRVGLVEWLSPNAAAAPIATPKDTEDDLGW